MPTGYYGNSRNIVISGSPVYRFAGVVDGQFQKEKIAIAGPSQKFDFELELGIYIAGNTRYGEAVKLEDVDDLVFGFLLLNDWSGKQTPTCYLPFPDLRLAFASSQKFRKLMTAQRETFRARNLADQQALSWQNPDV